jgi:putative tricarboxylic transport membrane protein
MDVLVMFVAGLLAYLLRRTGYSVAGIILGLILGKLGEQNFAQAMQMVSYDMWVFISRPIVAILLFAGALTIVVNIYRSFRPRRLAADADA